MAENEKKINGEVAVTVKSDYTAAYITIYPPKEGGRDITYDEIMDALALKAVRHDLKTELIRELVDKKLYDREIMVSGAVLPINGTNGSIKYNYDKEVSLAPVEDEKGFVDYKSLGRIRNINEGDVIAEITKPTMGTDGIDVRGVPIKAVPGHEASYSVGERTKLSDDGLKILAAADGNICWKGGGFCVETTVVINGDVDASVGNLDFIGDISVKGEVLEGFTIISAKNIIIKGNANGATLKAGGNVSVKCGIINSNVTAHGNIECMFAEHSRLKSDCSVKAQNLVLCDVYCGGDLITKALNGGKYTCLGAIEAGSIGTKNYAPTEVIAGDNAVLNKEKEEAVKRLSELDVMNGRLNQILEFLAAKKAQLGAIPADKVDLLRQSASTLMANQEEQKRLTARIGEIDASLSLKQNREVKVKGTIYPGTKVTINDSVMKFDIETVRVSVHLDENGNITTGPL
ncbi:MAG: DUF342 domain-containing protein [Huintestinicola sp.]